jgi:hypothetical protein
VQIGDFGFGRPQGFAANRDKPLLLAWVLNNYWMTNFRASQPGPMRFRYELHTHGAFDPVRATHAGLVAACPVEVHPAMSSPPAARQFIRVSDPAVVPVQFAPCDDGSGSLMVLLQNVSTAAMTVDVEIPGCEGRIYQSNALGERSQHLADRPPFTVRLPARGHCMLRIDPVGGGPTAGVDPSHEVWKTVC